MSPALIPKLVARHLRLQCRLLALWRHSATFPQISRSEDWTPWLEQRQRLMDCLRSAENQRLAADTNRALRGSSDGAAASCLRALQERELAIMEGLLSLDRLVQAAVGSYLRAVSCRLRSTHKARAARQGYRHPGCRACRLDNRG